MNTPSPSPKTRRKTPSFGKRPRKTQSRRQSIYPNRSPVETVRAKEQKRPIKSKRPVKPRIVMEIVEQEMEPEMEDPDRQVREFVAEMMAQNQARADAFVPPVYDPNGRTVLSIRPMPRPNISPELPEPPIQIIPPKTKQQRLAIKKANEEYGEFVKLFSEVFKQMREFDVLYNDNQLVISEMTPHDMFSETDPWKHKISKNMFRQILEDMKYVAELNAYVGNIENNMATNPDGFVESNFKQVIKELHKIHDRMKSILVKSHRPIRA